MSHATSPVPPNDAVPRWVVHGVEILLDAFRDVLFRAVQLQCLRGAKDGRSLHLHGHVRGLDLQLWRVLVVG